MPIQLESCGLDQLVDLVDLIPEPLANQRQPANQTKPINTEPTVVGRRVIAFPYPCFRIFPFHNGMSWKHFVGWTIWFLKMLKGAYEAIL